MSDLWLSELADAIRDTIVMVGVSAFVAALVGIPLALVLVTTTRGGIFEKRVVNSTLGVGGLADHATGMGIKPANEDYGQTLAKWGVNGGPYLVLPILGPSTLRDGVGSGVAQFADPAAEYLSRKIPKRGRVYVGDYDHLARVAEWTVSEEEYDV